MSVGVIYFFCFAVGLGYAIFVGVAGHLFGGDAGDAHMDVGTDLPLSPLSPTIIATFLTGFGGGGMLANSYFQMSVGKGVIVAIITGVVLSGGTWCALFVLFRSTQAGAEFSLDEMVGRTVQVITTIPENGTGEVALEAKGSRINGPAKSVDGRAIARNSAVTIVRVVGNLYYVREAGIEGPPMPS